MESRKRTFAENEVIEDLSCIVCHYPPEAEVFQCWEGHIMCKGCYEHRPRLKICPCCKRRLPRPPKRIRTLAVQNVLDKVIQVECSFKQNGCEYVGARSLAESHRARCFYNFEKYGQLVNLCQKLGYTSCNFQINNGNSTSAIDHFQTHHGVLLAQSPSFKMTLEHFKKTITLRSSPHFWTPIITKLPERQGHALLVPILNRNEDFACLSVWIPDPDHYNPSGLHPPFQVELELWETKTSEFCKVIFIQNAISIAKAMEVSLENLSRPIFGIHLKEHMRNEEKMTIVCKINGNGSSLEETDLETFFCKLNCPLQEPGAGKTEKALNWLEEEEAKAKVNRDSLWEFLFKLFDKLTKPDGYSYQEIAFVKKAAFLLVLRQGTAAQLNFLKSKGSKLHYKHKKSGRTNLHYTLTADNDKKIALEKIKILVNSGAVFKDLDNSGMSFLHHASFFGNIETVKYCLEELRLDTNATDDVNGLNPLHGAVLHPNEDCALKITQLLLDHGADPQMKTKDGEDLLKVAKPNYKEKLQEILRLHQTKKSRKQFMCSILSERF